jgi:hypothetical protein|tara:strand:+ start:469 stop:852 length:384 start_codon:yes stop_codon:yes gene_type:complete
MAVQQITGKRIKKFDEKNGNFQAKPQPEKKVDGNVVEEDVYGERKHTYVPEPNGNLQMEQMMGKLINKIDNIGSDSQTGTNAVEVDIHREIAISMVDQNAVKSEEIKGKVKTKKDKLKALRKRNGRK